MSQSDLYNICCRYHGRNVRITLNDGSFHVGKVTRISRNMVWIQPIGNTGGYGLGFFGGFGRFGIGFAFGAITGIVLASAFHW